jgi:hypothetical protein
MALEIKVLANWDRPKKVELNQLMGSLLYVYFSKWEIQMTMIILE